MKDPEPHFCSNCGLRGVSDHCGVDRGALLDPQLFPNLPFQVLHPARLERGKELLSVAAQVVRNRQGLQVGREGQGWFYKWSSRSCARVVVSQTRKEVSVFSGFKVEMGSPSMAICQGSPLSGWGAGARQ